MYLSPTADLSVVKRVAVFPFESLSQDRVAAEKVQRIVMIRLLSMGLFEVAEPGQVFKMVTDLGVPPSGMTPAQIMKAGQELKVQALLLGTVIDYGESRVGTVPTPEVTIQLRLVETASGVTMWEASGSRSGAKVTTMLFGVGGETLIGATELLVQRELNSLLEK